MMAMVNEWVQIVGPDIVLVLVLAGLWLALTAVYVPGTGIPEGAALVLLVLGGIGVAFLPTNIFGVLLLAAGLTCFLLLVIRPRWDWLILPGIGLQVLGSVFLFRIGARPSALTIALANLLALAYHQIVILPGLRVQEMQARMGTAGLIGAEGQAVSRIDPQGQVRLQGEIWSAFADSSIERGQRVRVVEREGLHLKVVPAEGSGNGYRPYAEAAARDIAQPPGITVGGLRVTLSRHEMMMLLILVVGLGAAVLLMALGAQLVANIIGAASLIGFGFYLVLRETAIRRPPPDQGA